MFGALIRAAERWRSVKVTEFERRRLASVRKELDQEYEAMVSLNTARSPCAHEAHLIRPALTVGRRPFLLGLKPSRRLTPKSSGIPENFIPASASS
jgi:hypothetical protein